MNGLVIEAAAILQALEDKGIRIAARRGAYGRSPLVIIDTKADKEYDYSEVEGMASIMRKGGLLTNVSAYEN
jgi:hypothetical protein